MKVVAITNPKIASGSATSKSGDQFIWVLKGITVDEPKDDKPVVTFDDVQPGDEVILEWNESKSNWTAKKATAKTIEQNAMKEDIAEIKKLVQEMHAEIMPGASVPPAAKEDPGTFSDEEIAEAMSDK